MVANDLRVMGAKAVISYCRQPDNIQTEVSSSLVIDLDNDLAVFLLRCNYKCFWLIYSKS